MERDMKSVKALAKAILSIPENMTDFVLWDVIGAELDSVLRSIGGGLEDNWYMGKRPVKVDTIKDLVEKIEGFRYDTKLVNAHGGPVTIRMSDNAGEIIIE